MTVENESASEGFIGDGSTVEFTFTLPTLTPGWMLGFVDDVGAAGGAVINEDQSNNPGGIFTFDDPPASGSDVIIQRRADFQQGTDYPTFTRFPAKAHEQALDKLTMITQQLRDDVASGAGGGGDGSPSLGNYVRRGGDTMLGHLNAVGTSEESPDTVVVQKVYVDDLVASVSVDLEKIDEKVVFHESVEAAEAASELDEGYGLHAAEGSTTDGITVVETGSNANGWWRKSSDGFIEQWGFKPATARGTDTTYNWAIPFVTEASVSIQATMENTGNFGTESYNRARVVSVTQFELRQSYDHFAGIYWSARGY